MSGKLYTSTSTGNVFDTSNSFSSALISLCVTLCEENSFCSRISHKRWIVNGGASKLSNIVIISVLRPSKVSVIGPTNPLTLKRDSKNCITTKL